MSEPETPRMGLDDVKPLELPPATASDAEEREALKSFNESVRDLANKPALHRTYNYERELKELKSERKGLGTECRDLQRRLTDLSARFASLQRSYSDLKDNLGGSALLIAAGSLIMGMADSVPWLGGGRPVWVGGAITVSGLIWSAWALIRSGNVRDASATGLEDD
jgi:hypothetical protein